MTYSFVENVRGFFVSRPPLVVFMICLGSFAVALITFAYVVKVKDMPDPDFEEDWNIFLKRLSSLEYYVLSDPGILISNTSLLSTSTSASVFQNKLSKIAALIKENAASPGGIATSTDAVGGVVTNLLNISVFMEVQLKATASLLRSIAGHNFTIMSATLSGHQLGLNDDRSDVEVNLTVILPPLHNHSHHCQQDHCFRASACVTMTAPAWFFPHTKHPEVDKACLRDPELLGENHFHLNLTSSFNNGVVTNASILSMEHKDDPSLTVMLSLQDRSMINLHLMHTSYFLFVMVVTLFCYAIIKGRPSKMKVVYMQCTSDKNLLNHA